MCNVHAILVSPVRFPSNLLALIVTFEKSKYKLVTGRGMNSSKSCHERAMWKRHEQRGTLLHISFLMDKY